MHQRGPSWSTRGRGAWVGCSTTWALLATQEEGGYQDPIKYELSWSLSSLSLSMAMPKPHQFSSLHIMSTASKSVCEPCLITKNRVFVTPP